ncbi:MAG: HAMP domain-containing sensor histidine kinase [Candidatus Latescibacteria bacterium]|jgi:signal transduction histidine kinase|nr:HAMP domain-containing sensor histidine kinase [Candidatus Latescibacterota bacterium]
MEMMEVGLTVAGIAVFALLVLGVGVTIHLVRRRKVSGMRHLAHQIHATILLVLVLFSLCSSIAWHVQDSEEETRFGKGALALLVDHVPSDDAPAEDIREAIEGFSELLGTPVGLWSADLALVHRTSEDVELSDDIDGPGITLPHTLPDGRILALVIFHQPHKLWYFIGMVATLAVAIGLGAAPLTRRLTRRLERLRTRVEDLGSGDLSARVEVEGRDEVADLARSFNAATARIEQLVDAQRTALMGASHELRTPLARLRVAMELVSGGGRDDLRGQIAADIEELDELIDEILLSSRLDTLHELDARNDEVDLLALAAEEAALAQADVAGESVALRGNERLLRRLVRNLVENAVRHGDTGSIAVAVERAGDRARLRVTDQGRGIPEAERQRIFEPFYRPDGTAESGRGYGLGLALVRRIARLHGGEVSCLEAPGGGCRFEVEMPVGDTALPSVTRGNRTSDR